MRVLAMAQAFKETLSVEAVADALASGVRAGGGEASILRGSDGGDGLLEALRPTLARRTRHRVTGPLGAEVHVEVGWFDAGTAVIESRLVCGLSLVPPARRDPSCTTTRGVGELIGQLEGKGAGEVYVGLGGSATMDGGVGMARAWGWLPLDRSGSELPEGGGSLVDLEAFRAGPRPKARINGLVDVHNPLTGPRGARVYAAQKGATPEATERLARGLERLAQVSGKAELAEREGAGAAGGLGFGILLFAGGRLLRGAPWVLDRIGFRDALRAADLILCGEGAFDATSFEGKLTGTVIDAARSANIPAGLLAPRAAGVPPGVLLETGGGHWSADELSRRAASLVQRALRMRRDA